MDWITCFIYLFFPLFRLTILKCDQNRLSVLNPCIGYCHSLQELVITENFLSEIPTSIGKRFFMTKFKKMYNWKIFFAQKPSYIFLLKPLHRTFRSANIKFLNFFLFWGQLWPAWSWIQIQSESGSETLEELLFQLSQFFGGSERLTNFRWKQAVDVDTVCR